MAYENSAIDTASRFGEIPFAQFTSDLIQSTFDALLQAHIIQLQEYQNFISAMTVSLSTYINNTINDVPMSDITTFLSGVAMPQSPDTQTLVSNILASASSFAPGAPAQTGAALPAITGAPETPSTTTNDFSSVPKLGAVTAIVSALGPSIKGLVSGLVPNKAELATIESGQQKYEDYLATVNSTVGNALSIAHQQVSISALLYRSIAATVASNKYALLQNMAAMGLLRLVISDGEIETKISFSTWEEHVDSQESADRDRNVTGSFSLARKGTRIRSIEREDGNIIDVPDGVIFPIVAAHAPFMRKSKSGWALAIPAKVYSDGDMIEAAKQAYFDIAGHNPQTMGKSKACYSTLARMTGIYAKLTD